MQLTKLTDYIIISESARLRFSTHSCAVPGTIQFPVIPVTNPVDSGD